MENKILRNLTFFLISCCIVYYFKDGGFFWDNTIFGYQMGNHLYNNGLFNFNFPDSFDPGHPPFLAILLATSWKLLGRTLLVSHAVLLPFIYGVFVQIYLFSKNYTLKPQHTFLAFILLIADPTLDAQLILIGPEVIHIFFFFLTINAIIKDNSKLKTIGLFFLGIVSFRGMLLVSGIVLFEVSRHIWIYKKSFISFFSKKNISTYTIGALPAIAYVIWRLATKGWLQTNPNSTYSVYWHYVNLSDFGRNIIVLIHRYADFGRVAIYLFIGYMLISQKESLSNKKDQELLLLGITSVITIIIISLLATNPFGHRYFIVSFMAFSMLAYRLLLNINRKKNYIILLTFLITGNLWIYPEKISQGWDASLAHIPYFNLRTKAISYLNSEHIEISNTATFSPNHGYVDQTDLSGNMNQFSTFTGEQAFVFYSNVFNLSDEDYISLEKDYKLIKRFSKGSVYIDVLKLKPYIKRTP